LRIGAGDASWFGKSHNTPVFQASQAGPFDHRPEWIKKIEFPERCPIAPENARFNFEVRQLLYGRKPHLYRILFTMSLNSFRQGLLEVTVAPKKEAILADQWEPPSSRSTLSRESERSRGP
jgi:hypothetical protein